MKKLCISIALLTMILSSVSAYARDSEGCYIAFTAYCEMVAPEAKYSKNHIAIVGYSTNKAPIFCKDTVNNAKSDIKIAIKDISKLRSQIYDKCGVNASLEVSSGIGNDRTHSPKKVKAGYRERVDQCMNNDRVAKCLDIGGISIEPWP